MGPFFTIGVYLMGLVALVDQGSKWWALGLVEEHAGPVRVTSFFNIVLSWNKGVTFGLLKDYGDWMPLVLIGSALTVVVLLLYWLAFAKNIKESLGLGFILGGAVGNVADRIRYGAVVDFLDFHVGGYHWYAFNIADSAIVLGVALLLLDNLVAGQEKR